MFLLVPAYPGCPGSKAVKRSSSSAPIGVFLQACVYICISILSLHHCCTETFVQFYTCIVLVFFTMNICFNVDLLAHEVSNRPAFTKMKSACMMCQKCYLYLICTHLTVSK